MPVTTHNSTNIHLQKEASFNRSCFKAFTKILKYHIGIFWDERERHKANKSLKECPGRWCLSPWEESTRNHTDWQNKMHFSKFGGRGGGRGVRQNPKSCLVSLGCLQKNGLREFLQGKQPLLPGTRRRAQHAEHHPLSINRRVLCQTTAGRGWAPAPPFRVLPRHSNDDRNTISGIIPTEKTAAKDRLQVVERAREPCRLKSAKEGKRKVIWIHPLSLKGSYWIDQFCHHWTAQNEREMRMTEQESF